MWRVVITDPTGVMPPLTDPCFLRPGDDRSTKAMAVRLFFPEHRDAAEHWLRENSFKAWPA